MPKKKTSRPKPARRSRRSVPAATASSAAPSAPSAGSSAQAPRSELLDRLDESGIRPSEVARVMESFFQVFGFHRHDISNCLGSIQGCLSLISFHRESETDEGDRKYGEWGGDELGEYISIMKGGADEALRSFSFYTRDEPGEACFGRVIEVITQAASINPALSVSIDSEKGPDFELLFPRILLKAIFKELFQNAVSHGRATVARVAWREDSAAVRIDIEDNGCGFERIRDRGTECFVGSISGPRHGLSLIEEALRVMNGIVTVSQSPDLGGAKISILFKPKLYWINGRLRKPE